MNGGVHLKINNNCARKILLEVEKIPFGETLTVANLQKKITDFSIEDIRAIVTLFNKEHYLTVLDKLSYDENEVFSDHKIKGLTEKGYKAFDLIKEDTIWNLMKEKLNNFDELSIYTILNIANKIMNVTHNELFDLPRDLFIENSRW